MISVDRAYQTILDLVQPLDLIQAEVELPILDAVNRILTRSLTSFLDFPHWDNSAMDGYAVRYADVQTCPVTLEIIEEIPAGHQPRQSLQPGQAARILTGSILPAGADTIVIQEYTQRTGDRVTVLISPEPQAFVRHRAEYYQAGTPLLSPGLRLHAPEIAVLAAAQCATVPVYRRPNVAIISAGDELAAIDQPLRRGQIVDSNQYALIAQLIQAGAYPIPMGIVPDDRATLKGVMERAIAGADIVISSGGVSVGDYDYVESLLEELGGTIHIRAIAVKPGKPLTVATFKTAQGVKLYFGLPGNPVSALVTFWRFVHPALLKFSGLSTGWDPQFVSAIARQSLKSDGKRESYLWGKLQSISGRYEFEVSGGSHSSGNLINLAGTNALAMIPVGQTHIPAGDFVQVMLKP